MIEIGIGIGINAAPSVALWTPVQVTTAAWFDASDISTVTQNNNLVSFWGDKSGNGDNAIQSTGSQQPTTGSNTINGLNTITFNGANSTHLEALNSASLNIDGIDKRCFVCVINSGPYVNRGSAYNAVFAKGELSNADVGYGIRLENDNDLTLKLGANLIEAPSDDYTGQNLLYSGLYDSITTDEELYINGALDDSSTGTSGASNNTSPLTLGGDSTSSRYFSGDIGELVIFDGEYREKIEGYLAWKFGLQASLPSNHRYKNGPPTI